MFVQMDRQMEGQEVVDCDQYPTQIEHRVSYNVTTNNPR